MRFRFACSFVGLQYCMHQESLLLRFLERFLLHSKTWQISLSHGFSTPLLLDCPILMFQMPQKPRDFHED